MCSNPRAVVGWILLVSLALTGIASSLTGALVLAGFLVAISLVAALPALVRRSWGETVPVSLLWFALLAGVAGTLGVYSEHAGYLAIVALALIVVVELDAAHGGDFTALWIALDVDSGRYVDRSRTLRSAHDADLPEEYNERWEDLLESRQLFAIGRENFKTQYHSKEVSTLSRTLLIVSLPAILATATAVLAIKAGLLPEVWLFGLPPLQNFVATSFTVTPPLHRSYVVHAPTLDGGDTDRNRGGRSRYGTSARSSPRGSDISGPW